MQSVFLTGGAGFLGRAILRRFEKEHPGARFTIYSRDEGKQADARRLHPQHRYILGDVRDADRLEAAIVGHDVVLHLAAMKYVPQGEQNVAEAIAVNVEGSGVVARAAVRAGVQRVVGISTDKACQPVNVYGMTKLLMERLFQEADGWSGTQFNLVRYGNVISSTGSVIPFFRKQALDGTVTITNPEMTRFWLTVEHAVELVERALVEPRGGTILIPRLPSLRMEDLAVAAAAAELGMDVATRSMKYRTIGQRFGEKVHEQLISPVERIYAEFAGHSGGDSPVMLSRMYPVLEGPRGAPETSDYSSDMPDDSLGVREMMYLILADQLPSAVAP